MARTPDIQQPTAAPRYDDPMDQRIADVVQQILSSNNLKVSDLPMDDIAKALGNQNALVPESLDRAYLENAAGGGYIVETSTQTTVALGAGVNNIAVNFNTIPRFFIGSAWPISSFAGFAVVGSVITQNAVAPHQGTFAVATTGAQNALVNWMCIRPRS